MTNGYEDCPMGIKNEKDIERLGERVGLMFEHLGEGIDKLDKKLDQLAEQARAERDRLITDIRWRIERHQDEVVLGLEPTEPIGPILQYIQALRDVPQQPGFPTDVEWPAPPAEPEPTATKNGDNTNNNEPTGDGPV